MSDEEPLQETWAWVRPGRPLNGSVLVKKPLHWPVTVGLLLEHAEVSGDDYQRVDTRIHIHGTAADYESFFFPQAGSPWGWVTRLVFFRTPTEPLFYAPVSSGPVFLSKGDRLAVQNGRVQLDALTDTEALNKRYGFTRF